jgi:hypothetical protein
VKNEKMARLIGRLRFERQRALGDFIRPREVPRERWRAMNTGERVAYEMKRVRVGA